MKWALVFTGIGFILGMLFIQMAYNPEKLAREAQTLAELGFNYGCVYGKSNKQSCEELSNKYMHDIVTILSR